MARASLCGGDRFIMFPIAIVRGRGDTDVGRGSCPQALNGTPRGIATEIQEVTPQLYDSKANVEIVFKHLISQGDISLTALRTYNNYPTSIYYTDINAERRAKYLTMN